jgi:hypothetical protein
MAGHINDLNVFYTLKELGDFPNLVSSLQFSIFESVITQEDFITKPQR